MKNPAVKAGQTIRILSAVYPNYSWIEGSEIEPGAVGEGAVCVYIPGVGYVDCQWEIVTPEEAANRYTMPDSSADMAAQIERLTKALEHEKAQQALTTKTISTLWDDFAKINEALGEEASDRDWCEDYEVFVNNVNAKMQMFSLDLPEIEYEVVVQRIRTVYEQTTVTVSGRRGISEYDLRDAAFEEAYNCYDWHEADYDVSDDYEIMDMNEA